MKLGISVRKREDSLADLFDRILLPISQEWTKTGRDLAGWPEAHACVSCFGHTAAVKKQPELAAVSQDGLPAVPGKGNPSDGFAWSWVCPNAKDYRSELLGFIRDVSSRPWAGLHLDSVGFPEWNYCHCPRCRQAFEASKKDWAEWRCEVVKEWLQEVSKATGRHLSISVHPEPTYHDERFGIDLRRIGNIVDSCLVPIYCLSYDLTYWMDTILYGFTKRAEMPVWVELYAVEPSARGLVRAMSQAAKFPIEGIILYDHQGKWREVARLFREDPEVRALVAASRNSTVREIAERMASWVTVQPETTTGEAETALKEATQ